MAGVLVTVFDDKGWLDKAARSYLTLTTMTSTEVVPTLLTA